MSIIPSWLWPILSFCISFLLVLMVQPSITQVGLEKNFDYPNNNRHKKIPQLTLGGIAVFIGIILASIFCVRQGHFPGLHALISAMVILLFTGVIFDCRIHYRYLRVFSKLIAAVFIVLMSRTGPSAEKFALSPWINISIQILAVGGFIHFYHHFTKLHQQYFLISGFINAFIFSIFFLVIKEYDFSVIAFALSGSLSGTIVYTQYAIWKKKPFARLGHTGIYMIAIVLALLWLKLADILIEGI